MNWEVVIGLETHAQLSTASKIFSGASTAFGAAPNTQACAVDIALPGVLPVLNRGAVERAIRFGLAVGATINRRCDLRAQELLLPRPAQGLPDQPVRDPGRAGRHARRSSSADGEKTVRLTRAHLEEDAGKSLHEDFHGMTGIDLNRAGTPLLEIVSEPDMRSAAGGGRLREGAARAGALDRHLRRQHAGRLVPLRRQRLGAPARREPSSARAARSRTSTRFRFMQQAIEFEVRRQIELIEDGGKVVQETRLYDRTAARRARCAPRKTRRTTATSPTRTCCRWRFRRMDRAS